MVCFFCKSRILRCPARQDTRGSQADKDHPLWGSHLPLCTQEQMCFICFFGGVDWFLFCFVFLFLCHKLNPTNQKAQLSFETSASLGLIRRGRQQGHIEICMSEVGSASELTIVTELAVSFPCGEADLSLAYVCGVSAASFNFFPPIVSSIPFFSNGMLFTPS